MQSSLPPEALALRPRDAAKALGICEKTLWTWTKANQVPHVKMGRAILYPTDALRRWLEEKANGKERTP
jgi:excisionase family DNA binding protein